MEETERLLCICEEGVRAERLATQDFLLKDLPSYPVMSTKVRSQAHIFSLGAIAKQNIRT